MKSATMKEHDLTPEPQHHIGVNTLFVVFGALIALMFLTFGIAFVDLGPANFPVAMAIATAKMALIITYFMHVRFSSTLTKVFSCAAFFWLLILVTLTLNDYFTRGELNVPGK